MSAPNKSLTPVADLLEKGWTQGVMARDEAGRVCDHHSEQAVSFCVAGAAGRVLPKPYQLRYAICGALGGECIAEWNDAPGRTQAEVVDLVRKVELKLVRKKGQKQ